MAVKNWDSALTEWMQERGLAASFEREVREKTEFFTFFSARPIVFKYKSGRQNHKDPNFKVNAVAPHFSIEFWVQYNSNIKRWCVSAHTIQSSAFGKLDSATLHSDFETALVKTVDELINKLKSKIDTLGNSEVPKSQELLENLWRAILGFQKP